MKLEVYEIPYTSNTKYINKLIYLLEIEEDIYYVNYNNIKDLIKEYKRNGIKYRFNDFVYSLNEFDLIYEKEYNSIKELEFDYLQELIWF